MEFKENCYAQISCISRKRIIYEWLLSFLLFLMMIAPLSYTLIKFVLILLLIIILLSARSLNTLFKRCRYKGVLAIYLLYNVFSMLHGYLNLFCNPKYEKIKNAFLNHPYIIGGEDRSDTKIIEYSKNIVAKVGAGGLCIVVNTKTEEAFVVKIADCDMKARELVVCQILKNIHWADVPMDLDIKTIHGQKVGEIKILI